MFSHQQSQNTVHLHTVAAVFPAVGNICYDTEAVMYTVLQLRCQWDFTDDKINSACHVSRMLFEIVSFPEETRTYRAVFLVSLLEFSFLRE
jgi:hypothetical protein